MGKTEANDGRGALKRKHFRGGRIEEARERTLERLRMSWSWPLEDQLYFAGRRMRERGLRGKGHSCARTGVWKDGLEAGVA